MSSRRRGSSSLARRSTRASPHGALSRSGRQRVHAPPPLRACRCALSCSSAIALCRCRRSRRSTGGSPISRGSTRTRGPGTAPAGASHHGGAPCSRSMPPRSRRRVKETHDRGRPGRCSVRASHRGPPAGRLTRAAGRQVPRSQRGALGARTARRTHPGVVVEEPLYVRVVNTIEGGSLFWRLLDERGGGAEQLQRDRGAFLSRLSAFTGYVNAVSEIVVGDAAKVEFVRCRTSRGRAGTSPPTTRRSRETRSWTG